MVIFSAVGGRDVQLDLFTVYRKRLTLYGLDTAAFSLDHVGDVLKRIGPYIASGKLQEPKVEERYPLSKARQAYERVQSGAQGKVIITMPLPQ